MSGYNTDMAKRKIIVDQKEYRYVVGRSFTKIDQVGLFRNEKIGYEYTNEVFAVRPSDIEREIRKHLSK
jgi:hypothetical protein